MKPEPQHKFEIKMTAAGYGEVFKDGERVTGVLGFDVHAQSGCLTTITLRLFVRELLISGPMRVVEVREEGALICAPHDGTPGLDIHRHTREVCRQPSGKAHP